MRLALLHARGGDRPDRLVEGDFAPFSPPHFTRPLEDGRSLCEGIVFIPRNRNALLRALWQPLSLKARRTLTYGFVADEAQSLRGVRYNPAGLVAGDRDMIEFFRWAAELPRDVTAAR